MGILFMRAITLDGAGLGIYHFFHIKPESFLNSETWIDSATQVSMICALIRNKSFKIDEVVTSEMLQNFATFLEYKKHKYSNFGYYVTSQNGQILNLVTHKPLISKE